MIGAFQENYRWLSNFAPCKIWMIDREYPSVEHAYMSAKSHDSKWKDFCADANNPAGLVKREGKKIKIRDNWEDIKMDTMRSCLEQKFKQEPYKTKLIETGDQNIQEGNYWSDRFWGIDLKVNPNVGENRLGRMIMEIRDTL